MVWLKRYIEGHATDETLIMSFSELSLYEKKSTRRSSGTTLSQRDFSHLKSYRRVWSLVVSADETIDDEKKLFLEEFWCSHRAWFYEGESEPLEAAYIEVTLPEGEMPREFLLGSRYLVEDAFTLTEKEGRLL